MTMYNPQKLHPVSYVTSLINVIKNNFIVIIIFLFNIKDFKYDDFYSYLWPGIMTLIFLITFFYNISKFIILDIGLKTIISFLQQVY